MNKDLGTIFCPKCKQVLIKHNTNLLCNTCNQAYSIRNGIPQFVDKEIFWCEPGIDEETMRRIVSELDYRNWHELLENNDSEAVRKNYFFINNLERAKWHHILGLSPNSVILDLGAGMGTISHAFSQYYRHIMAVEPVQLRCEFMKHRFRQERIENVDVIRANSSILPFPDNYFDHIILNGVLEWVPYSYKNMRPKSAQLLVLRELRKLLRNGGSISIGIENRFHYAFLLGTPDCHMGVRYVTVLPRVIADIICNWRIGDIYRPYLYSSTGLKRLLTRSGYGDVTLFNSIPSYNEPEYTVNMNSRMDKYREYIWPTKNNISLMLRNILSELDLLKHFSYAFRAVAFRKDTSRYLSR